ncbi:MAG: hypothetical protein JSR86_14180 [Proteobacteria bacterium]|nr:hypothetical protein [Pseudomonadota bacterium]
MRTSHIVSMLGAAGALVLATAPTALPEAANPEGSKPPAASCFFSRDWQGWKATPDDKAIYIRVGRTKVYRLDLSSPCPSLHDPGSHLITKFHGSGSVCTALDIDLKVSDGHIATACIVRQLSELSPAEAAALPKNLQP